MFWILIAAFCSILFFMVYTSLRPAHAISGTARGASLKDLQLQEIEQDLLLGQIDEKEAKAMRLETERAAMRRNRNPQIYPGTPGPLWVIWGGLGASLLAAILLYGQIGLAGMPDMPFELQENLRRPSQETAYEILKNENALAPLPKADEETTSLILQLEDALENRPDEARGWEFLARASYSTSNFKRAYEAQSRFISLKEEPTAEDYSFLAENMILAVNGYISPEAENALRNALKLDPKSRVARYYAGLAMIQEGEVSQGRALLTALLKDTKDDPNWSAEIQKRLDESALSMGPSDEDIENAQNMSDEDRQTMILGMVDGLKARLAESGGSPDEWARLIRALRVLDRNDEADRILQEAKDKFPDDPNIQALQ